MSAPTEPRVVGAPAPVFDPGPSAEFIANACGEIGAEAMLIGRLAVYAWLDGRRDPQYTKDVDVAVRPGDLTAFRLWAEAAGLQTKVLRIGGVMAASADERVRIDFIDRTNEEYGDLGPLIAEAFGEARRSDLKARVGERTLLLCPVHHLIALKFVANRDKDIDDVRALLKVKEVDVGRIRDLLRRFTNGFVRQGFESLLVRIDHPGARTYEDAES